MRKNCPICKNRVLKDFYSISNVPVNSVLLLDSKEEALNFPKGNIRLAYCKKCGFITNVNFDSELLEYSSRYEGTQAFSPTFNSFNNKLARYLIKRYDLHKKVIIEIGCGQGEFLHLLCDLGNNFGIGFDPAFDKKRSKYDNNHKLKFVKDFYSEKYKNLKGDFICCKMTLEHIHNPTEFIQAVRSGLVNQDNITVFFQVPDVQRILKECAFWDIYYEHCSYFSQQSLQMLFSQNGFQVLNTWQDFGDQYLMIEARLSDRQNTCMVNRTRINEMEEFIINFINGYPKKIQVWREFIKQNFRRGRRIVLWGGGSKGVAFLTTLNICNEIEVVVDINPYKNNTYIPGTGQKIVSPEFLRYYNPHYVIVMNPIYLQEIKTCIHQIGLRVKVVPVTCEQLNVKY